MNKVVFSISSIGSIFGFSHDSTQTDSETLGTGKVSKKTGRDDSAKLHGKYMGGLTFLANQLQTGTYDQRLTALHTLKASSAKAFASLKRSHSRELSKTLRVMKRRFGAEYETQLKNNFAVVQASANEALKLIADLEKKALNGDEEARDQLLEGKSFHNDLDPEIGSVVTDALIDAQRKVVQYEQARIEQRIQEEERLNKKVSRQLAVVKTRGLTVEGLNLALELAPSAKKSRHAEAFSEHLETLNQKLPEKLRELEEKKKTLSNEMDRVAPQLEKRANIERTLNGINEELTLRRQMFEQLINSHALAKKRRETTKATALQKQAEGLSKELSELESIANRVQESNILEALTYLKKENNTLGTVKNIGNLQAVVDAARSEGQPLTKKATKHLFKDASNDMKTLLDQHEAADLEGKILQKKLNEVSAALAI